MNDKVEVVIPTRNAPSVLFLALTHLLAYNTMDVSGVTLLDTGSTAPGTDDVLNWAARGGFRVIRNEANIGVWACVNRGLALVRSSKVLILTSDVLLGPRTIRVLSEVMDSAHIPFLGPEVTLYMSAVPNLTKCPPKDTVGIDTSKYNGACWMMNWPELREKVGWFDPQFYVCAGDTDYIERMRLARVSYGVLVGLPCVHLDKQTRKNDGTADKDTEMEVQDLTRFHRKWEEYPEILYRHPIPRTEIWNAYKSDWEETTIR